VRVEALERLDPVPHRTVVINVGTDLVAARAVLSACEVAGGAVLLVNCEPSERSSSFYDSLAERWAFDIVDAPLRSHGRTLDWLFATLDDALLLLLDSDAELRSRSFVGWMQEVMANPWLFGSGFSHGPFWLDARHGAPDRTVMYVERPWLPCVTLRTEHVRRALGDGLSFEDRFAHNDVAFSTGLSRLLAARFSPPWGTTSRVYDALPRRVRGAVRGRRLRSLEPLRQSWYGAKPAVVFYDTGAEVYQHLKHGLGLGFAGLPMELIADEVHHFHGVTRTAIGGALTGATTQEEVQEAVLTRLAQAYDLTVDQPW
jgi:hypothetical protein